MITSSHDYNNYRNYGTICTPPNSGSPPTPVDVSSHPFSDSYISDKRDQTETQAEALKLVKEKVPNIYLQWDLNYLTSLVEPFIKGRKKIPPVVEKEFERINNKSRPLSPPSSRPVSTEDDGTKYGINPGVHKET